ncbi:beta-glucanase [Paenibacillus terricola]
MIGRKSLTCLSLLMLLVTGCSEKESASKSAANASAETWVQPFKVDNAERWEKSTGYSNGNPFDCTWSADHIRFQQDSMQLKLTAEDSGQKLCSEYKTLDTYHYGKYEVRMKAAKSIGIVSSFFTYTGPSFGTAWDEIDIEFLGKDTNKVQLNYYTDGVGGHEKLVDLGFDASEDFHDYAFEWRADSIKWYIDGQLVHTATDNLPVTPGKIMMNLWNGTGVDEWLGHYDGESPITAEYQWMKFTPFEDESSAAAQS